MQSKTKTIGFLEVLVIDKLTKKVKSTHKGCNTITVEGEELIAELLSGSFVNSNPYPTDQLKFVDRISIGAGFKLTGNSSGASTLTLPYSPIDGSEEADMYQGCTIYAISGPNQGESKEVASYDPVTRLVTVTSPFSNVPLTGEVYVISTDTREVQLQGEGEQDENGNVIVNTKSAIDYSQVKVAPNVNEAEKRAEWIESDGDYIVAECGLWFDLDANTHGESSSHTHPGKLFARATFANNPPHKTINDILQIRWTIRVGAERI